VGVQLRHYPIKPGQMDRFLETFPKILAVRQTFGFRCIFAFADRKRNDFIICVEGDFDEAEARYASSAELAAVEEATGARELFDPPSLQMVEVVRSIWEPGEA
jgi:heme-degrading monooxygenase HmoA